MDTLIEKLVSKGYMQNIVITVASNIIILMVGLMGGFLLKQLFFK
ncbi:hypothetical protein [Neobacillus sp. D3-1R]